MKVITVAAIKGGTGKTTTAAALSQAAAKEGFRILAVDLDPQGNLTQALGAARTRANAYSVLTGDATAKAATQATRQGVDVIAGCQDLTTLKTMPGSALRLKKALAQAAADYDVCIIDTPPQMGELTFNALTAADGLIIPLEADGASIQGFYQIADLARATMRKANPGLSFIGVILTRYDGRPKINRYLKEQIGKEAAAAGIPYLGEIRAGIAIKEAQGFAESLFDYAPRAKPAKDYLELYGKVKAFLNEN